VSTDAAAAPSVSPDLVEAFHFRGDRRPPCLLIHGFTGTPYEVRGLGEHLHSRGHAVLGVRLTGHARPVEELEQSRWTDWYADVAEGCTRLVAESGPVAAVGMSAGALLALHLAHERPNDVMGLALMAPAIALRDWRARWAMPLIARTPWLRGRFRLIPKTDGSDIRDEEARRIHPGHRFIPLAAAMSLVHLQRQVRGECGEIDHPTLLIHGARDRTCPPSNVDLLARCLGRAPKRVLILPESAHVVTVDCERDRVEAAVSEFVAELG